jgi:hypothetical protein
MEEIIDALPAPRYKISAAPKSIEVSDRNFIKPFKKH